MKTLEDRVGATGLLFALPTFINTALSIIKSYLVTFNNEQLLTLVILPKFPIKLEPVEEKVKENPIKNHLK